MDKRVRERLELEGNSVFTDLRMERDTLRQQWDELSALAHDRAHSIERLEREKAALLEALEEVENNTALDRSTSQIVRIAIRAAKGA